MRGLEQTLIYPNAIVRVHRPDLTDEERERRMAKIKRSAEILLKGVMKNEHDTRNTDNN